MRNLLRILALLPALTLAACGGSSDSDDAPPVELGEEFELRYGQTIDVGPLTLEFIGVVEDTRCPINAACVAFSEGNARIQLAASTAKTSDIIELDTNPALHPFVVYQGHFIILQHLVPEFPWAPRGPLGEYKATLLVDGQAVPGI